MASFEYAVVETESDSGHIYFRVRGEADKEEKHCFFKDEVELMLDKMGAGGWILCGILSSFDQDTRYLFKRPVNGAIPMEYKVIGQERHPMSPAPDKIAYLLCSPEGQPFYEGELDEDDRRQFSILVRWNEELYRQDWELCFVYISHSFGNIYNGDGISNEKIFILMRPLKVNAESRKVE